MIRMRFIKSHAMSKGAIQWILYISSPGHISTEDEDIEGRVQFRDTKYENDFLEKAEDTTDVVLAIPLDAPLQWGLFVNTCSKKKSEKCIFL